MKRMHKAVSFLLAACLCGTPLPVGSRAAAASRCGDNLTWSIDGSGTLTVSGSGEMWDFLSPSLWEPIVPGLSQSPWHSEMTNIRQICIEEGVTGIGQFAFAECQNLTEVTLPATLRQIGRDAFEWCFGLESVSFQEGLESIGTEAFFGTSIRQLSLPASLRSIGRDAFRNCSHLTSAELSEGLVSVGDFCFSDCVLLEDFTLPDSVTDIGDSILLNCYAWTEKHLQDEFAMLNDHYLYRYYGSSTRAVIPETVEQLDKYCFYRPHAEGARFEDPFYDLESVTLPESICTLPEELFADFYIRELNIRCKADAIPADFCRDCTELSDVTLPDGLKAIGASAFSHCEQLYELRIPDTVTEIGEAAFEETPFLEQAEDFLICGDGLLLRYAGSRNIVTVPDGVKTVCCDAFRDSDAVAVTLPASVRTLCANSFRGKQLIDITLNDGLTEIPNDVFCAGSIWRISIPESVTEISPYCCAEGTVFTVVGAAGSAAEKFAEEANLPFTEITQQGGADMTPDPERDYWSFTNSYDVFSGDCGLLPEDAELLTASGFTPDSGWSGACFGMCVTILLAKNGVFSPQQIDSSAASLHDLAPTEQVQSVVNYYQYLQKSEAFWNYLHQYPSIRQSIYLMMRTADQIPHGASPFLLCFDTAGGGRHAMIGCGHETGSWEFRGRAWTDRITVYDPNIGGCDDSCCVYYDPEEFAICIPQYDLYWDNTISEYWLFFRVCTDLCALNQPAYPFAERFGTGTPGDADGDGAVTQKDAALLTEHLLCKTVIPAAAAKRADLSGDGRLTAADLALLKRRLLNAA